ncbi:MAG: YbaB/EbfC family nucleoid-associated protein [Christensenellaceae bacterium]|nr:YbaB/EbfC family nucleoid-associated protein [Christensenellaceae bacterium]
MGPKSAMRLAYKIIEMPEEMNAKEFEATAGGGMVKAVVTGAKVIKSVTIAPEVVDPDDIEMLEDLVVAAVNEALATAAAEVDAAMGKATGGMNLGGMF